ncbi:MAG: phospholipid carrier-dependent glycosyltransferase [Dehalococcoidales bacterium]|nr:phospholipid carrier-dependent glycosyltransferase [Dehalococcoidales bacterium]
MEIKNKFYRFYRWQYFWLFLIVLSTLILHFSIIDNPEELVFDEQHYINDARYIIVTNETVRAEHPPLAKLIFVAGEYIFSGFESPQKDTGTTLQQAVDSVSTSIYVSDASVLSVKTTIRIDKEHMYIENIDTSLNKITVNRGYGTTAARHDAPQTIYVFDDNPWGWRVFPVLFGTAAIVLFYFLCRRLNLSPAASNIAAFLLAFENLTFVQSSIAMLDVFYLTFMMAAFLLYVCRRYISSGVAIGLSALSKLNGLLALPVIGIHWIFSRRPRSWWFLLVIMFSIIAFVELMLVFDLAITHDFSTLSNPFHRIGEMQSLSSSLTFASVDHPAASHAWEWVIRYTPMAYWYMPHYTGAISFTIWAMVIPVFIYMLIRAIKGSDAGLFGISWIAATYLIWIPATLITNRVTYIFYFYPTIGAICLGLGMALNQLLDYFHNGRITWLRRTLLIIFIVFLAAHLVSFIILSPVVPFDFGGLVGITH